MFDTNYYCLVAGLREYSLDGGAKGFDPHAILDEILRELTPRDLRAVRLLDRKSTRLNSSHSGQSRMPSSA